MTWIAVAEVTEIPLSQWKVVTVQQRRIAIFNVDGDFFALEDRCSHDGSPLAGEPVENGRVICPRHGAEFCVKTGEVLAPPAYEDIEAFPTRVIGSTIEVDI